MKKLRRLSIINVLFYLVVIFFVIHLTSMRWLDKHSWVFYPDNRWFVKTLPYFYLKNPFSSQDNDIERTIKIARFIALSKQHDKPLDVLLVDLYEAQKLIEDFERMRGNKLDIVALSKLTVNRLNLLNRINAIYLSQDRKITLDLDVVRNKGKELVENIDDVDIKKALQKEIFFYDENWQGNEISNVDNADDWFVYIDKFHYGLAQCIVGKESGAQLIISGIDYFTRDELVDLVMLSVDFPLILAASFRKNASCVVAIDEVFKKLRE